MDDSKLVPQITSLQDRGRGGDRSEGMRWDGKGDGGGAVRERGQGWDGEGSAVALSYGAAAASSRARRW
jgi:hypothetical protein